MTKIKLYNTKTRTKEDFVPIDPANVRMYVCGPTVYDRAHIGNARPVVVFDTLFRLLRHKYGHYAVRYVRNFTDVDDKINTRASEIKAKGDARDLKAIIRELTDQTIKWYHEDMEALGTLRPTDEPRATEYIAQMVSMIEVLIEKGNAYVSEGHVLFDVNSYDAYGALSGRKLEDMRAGERVEVADYKRDPMDFVLWKPSSDDLPGWNSPWGRGRPGWHIECSAMSLDLLGETFDIHGGGLDLQFPHHENEIAQSCCANPDGGFANVWMHNEMIQVEGKKMSKSLGNFFTVKDLLDQGIPGEVIRFVLLSTHYRSPMDWTDKKVAEATATLRKWRKQVSGVTLDLSAECATEALAEDLNLADIYMRMHSLSDQGKSVALKATGALLGLLEDGPMGDWAMEPSISLEEALQKIGKIRRQAREAKNYGLTDEIRHELKLLGIELKDTAVGFEFSLDRMVSTGLYMQSSEGIQHIRKEQNDSNDVSGLVGFSSLKVDEWISKQVDNLAKSIGKLK